MDPQIYTQPMSDYDTNSLTNKDGLLNTTVSLSLDLPDKYITKTLNKLIKDSQDYYDDVNRFNLKNKRLKNERMLQGKHLQEHKLYRHQTPYIDNEIYVGVDAIKAYVTAQTPKAEVYPAGKKEEDKLFAKDLENYAFAHSEAFKLAQKLEGVVDNSVGKYIGFIKLRWDPNYGRNGEVIPEVIDSNHVIVDKNAKRGENPRFISQTLKNTIEGVCSQFPDKAEALKKMFSVHREGPHNMSAEIAYKEVWFTYYDDDNKPQEAVAWYVRDLVLDKCRNPNWLYDNEGENFLDQPLKPFIPFNFDNDGSHWYDRTSAVEQAIPQQEILNKLGRQILDNLSTANGFKVFDAKFITKDDLQNMTGDPNQSIVGKVPVGRSINDVVKQLDPQMVSPTLVTQLQATVQTIHGILGTPSQFRGDDQDLAKTASTNLQIKNQASGRQDKIVRAIDYGMDQYFKFLTQMFCVHYKGTHYATVNGGDGNFDFVEMRQDKIHPRMTPRVQAGTTLPFDKARQEAVAQNAADAGLLAPYDYYRLMHMENPQQLYDNLVKWKTQPQELAMDLANNDANGEAIVDFTDILSGKKPQEREDITPKYIEQMRKLMITDRFLNAKTGVQTKMIAFVKQQADAVALKEELDQMSASPPPPPIPSQVQATLPPQAPQPAPMPGMPPVPPQGGIIGPSPIQAIMSGQAPLGAPQQPTPSPSLNAQPQVNAANPAQLPPF